jgi:hypothetical protein
MKRTNVLWVSLAALVLYIAMNSQTDAQVLQPQTPTTVRLTQFDAFNRHGQTSVQVSGKIVGFSCVDASPLSGPQCYVATTD